MMVEKISAVTLRVADMRRAVRFYRDILGMELLYGGKTSLRAKDAECPILNLEQGHSVPGWGRMIFYVADVDGFWEYLRGKGFNPESPRDDSWGERYFHMPDPDGHELSFACRDPAVFQQSHELVRRRREACGGLAQHWWAQVLPGMGFPEWNDIRDTSRVHERSYLNLLRLLGGVAQFPEHADEGSPREWAARASAKL